jgi:hypothetical protein
MFFSNLSAIWLWWKERRADLANFPSLTTTQSFVLRRYRQQTLFQTSLRLPTILRCSELSSGIYCRVKWLSTDVSEVRTASIIRELRCLPHQNNSGKVPNALHTIFHNLLPLRLIYCCRSHHTTHTTLHRLEILVLFHYTHIPYLKAVPLHVTKALWGEQL